MAIISENFQSFTYKSGLIKGYDFDRKIVDKYCDALKEEDEIRVLINSDFGSIVAYNLSIEDELEQFKEDLESYSDEDICIDIHIQKSMTDGYVNVYSYAGFSEFLQEREIQKLFSDLAKYIRSYGALRCYVCDKEIDLELNSIIFSNDIERLSSKKGLERKERVELLNKIHTTTYVQEDNIGELVPHDLRLITASGEDELKNFFEQILMVLSISCIANYVEIKEYSVAYRMMGYKVVSGEYTIKNVDNIHDSVETLLKLVMWIYAEDFNTVDKCEIARNILSLHIQESWNEVGKEAFLAIVSNYRVYLKTSVDHYLEIKNEVVDKITELNEAIFSNAKEFAISLKNNILALFSFFVTTLVINTIATGKIENIFTKDIVTLSYGFIAISVLYILVVLGELKRKKEDIKHIYDSSKKLYLDVLSQEDIMNIYCNDDIFNENMKNMDDIVKRYCFYWGFVMIIIFIVITSLKVEVLG